MRVALLSNWHVHAKDYAAQVQSNPRLELAGVWDEDPQRGQRVAKELTASWFPALEQVWEDETIAGVIVTTATARHPEIITQAAAHGKHVFSEKVLAFTEDDCQVILDAVDKAGVRLMLSLPRLSDPYYLYTQQAVNEGWLGQVNTVRCRVAHNGAVATAENPRGWLPEQFFDPVACGGGALVDLGAHPIYLANRLAGQPVAVTARLNSLLGRGVDDTSVAVVEYENGVMGVLETGFTSGKSPFILEVHGSRGSVLVEDGKVRIRSEELYGGQWETPDLPQQQPLPMEQWVAWIEEGRAPLVNRQDMLNLTRVNEAAVRSHAEACRWRIRGFT